MERHTVQRALLNYDIIFFTGLHWLLRRQSEGSGVILTFHRVRPYAKNTFEPNLHLEVTPEFLGDLIDWVQSRDIDIVGLDEAKQRLATASARRFVVLTFDDGFRDVFEFALPVLKARNASFTVYAATGFIERTVNPWWLSLEAVVASNDRIEHPNGSGKIIGSRSLREKIMIFNQLSQWFKAIYELEQQGAIDGLADRHEIDIAAMVDEAFMNWDELGAMAAEPLSTIGAHTHNHFALAKLSPEKAREEVMVSADLLAKKLGERPRHFAYPYGFARAVGERDHQLLADLGFATAVVTSPGVLRRENLAAPTRWPRISMNGHFQRVRHASTLIFGLPFWPAHIGGRRFGRFPGSA